MEGHGMEVGRPDRRRLAVWESYLRSHAALMRVLERDLQTAHQMSLAEYDVLVHLNNAPAQRLRMGELAQAVLFSTGGLSRLLDRMEQAGLVARERTADDRRGVYAVLTMTGCERFRQASDTHMRGVQDLFAAVLGADEIEPVARFLARLNERMPDRAAVSCPADASLP